MREREREYTGRMDHERERESQREDGCWGRKKKTNLFQIKEGIFFVAE